MAENSTSSPNASNHPLPSPQIASSSSMIEQPYLSSPQLPQLQHCNNSNSALDYNTLQQQLIQLQQQQIQLQQLHSPTYPSLNFQNRNNAQRPGGRMNQINQQFTRFMATNAAQPHEMYARRMNLDAPQINQTQWTTRQMGGGMPQTRMMGPDRRLPVLPAQAALRFNPQYQMLEQNRRNSSGQSLLGMQTPATMMGALGLNTQLGANGFPSSSLQDFRQLEIRRNQLSQQNPLAPSQILRGPGLRRTSTLATMSPNLSASTQNRQSILPQNSLSQNHLDLYQHQISRLVQQQQQQQLQLSTQQRQLQPRDLPPLSPMQQQLFSSMPGLVVQESVSPIESRGGPPGSGTDSSSEGTETSSQLLGKRKIRDLAAQVDPLCKLDPEVEDMLLEMADNFIDNVTASACRLAKHRKSSTLDSKDVLLHLEKNCHLTVPGHTRGETKNQENSLATNIPKKRQEAVKRLLESQNPKRGTGGARGTV